MGMQLLARSAFNPKGMTDFFEKLQKNSRYFAKAPEFLRTHPLTSRRIADSRARAAAYPQDKRYAESKSFYLIKAKLIVKTYQNPEDAVAFFTDKLSKARSGEMADIFRYGHVIALTAAGQYGAARRHIRALLSRYPENIAYLLAAADIEVQQGEYDDAFAIFSEAEKIYPDYRPLVLMYTNALLTAGQPRLAQEKLHHYGRFHAADITYYDYLTRAEADSGNMIASSMANAEYYFLTGETRVAIEQLKHILRQPGPRPDYYQTERIHARLAYLERELQIERDLKLRR